MFRVILQAITIFTVLCNSRVEGVIEVIFNSQRLPDRAASFGPKLPVENGLTGILIPIEAVANVSDRKGCQALQEPITMKLQSSEMPWVALVERGNCSFVQKVRAMQASGASAVIIGDDRPGGGLIRMFSPSEDTVDIKIPSVFVMNWEYQHLKSLMTTTAERRKFISIAVGAGKQPTPHLVVRMLRNEDEEWPMADVVAVALMIPGIIFFFLWLMVRCRMILSDEDDDTYAYYETIILLPGQRPLKPHERPASLEAVNRLSKRKFCGKERGPNEPDLCAICLEDFEEGEELRLLPCKHEFHVSCIDPWLLTRKRFCPICKGDSCPDHPGAEEAGELEAAAGTPDAAGVAVTNPRPGSPMSIDLDPAPQSVAIEVEPETEDDVGRPLLRGQVAVSSNTSRAMNLLRGAWQSTTSLLSLSSPASNSNATAARSLPPPFPVVDQEDYQSARQLALNNRRRRGR